MMQTYIKIHYIGCCYGDADKIERKDTALMTPREILYAQPLKKPLSFLDWMHYMCFCGSIAFGMATEYKEFKEFINLEGNYGKMPVNGPLRPAFKRFF